MQRLDSAFVGLFLLSSAFPVVACVIAAEMPPRWLGIADVVVAALLVAVALTLYARAMPRVTDEDRTAAFEATRRLALMVPTLLVLFFLLGDRVKWNVLVIGLAWRAWLLLQVLPSLIASRRLRPAE